MMNLSSFGLGMFVRHLFSFDFLPWWFTLMLIFFHCVNRFDAADKGEDFDKAIKEVKKDKDN